MEDDTSEDSGRSIEEKEKNFIKDIEREEEHRSDGLNSSNNSESDIYVPSKNSINKSSINSSICTEFNSILEENFKLNDYIS